MVGRTHHVCKTQSIMCKTLKCEAAGRKYLFALGESYIASTNAEARRSSSITFILHSVNNKIKNKKHKILI